MFACLSLARAMPRGPDTKIIAVPVKEPRLAEIQDLQDIPAHVKEEIHNFFIHYKDLEDTTSFARVTGWSGREEALATVHRGIMRDGGGAREECGWLSAPGRGRGGGGNMKFNAVWILNVLGNTTRCMEKQKLWAETAACGASL